DTDTDTDTDVDTVDEVDPDAPCTVTGHTAGTQVGYLYPGDAYVVVDQDAEAAPYNELALEVYESAGGPTGPFTHTVDDENYETCAICVTGGRDCSGEAGCSQRFLGIVGELDVTEAAGTDGGAVKGTATGLKLFEVVIDGDTYKSSYVKDGAVWCVDNWTMDATLVDDS
ncbi:MAG: hypothetical protein AB8H79_25420, partial [Myxococcota bacterium]